MLFKFCFIYGNQMHLRIITDYMYRYWFCVNIPSWERFLICSSEMALQCSLSKLTIFLWNSALKLWKIILNYIFTANGNYWMKIFWRDEFLLTCKYFSCAAKLLLRWPEMIKICDIPIIQKMYATIKFTYRGYFSYILYQSLGLTL